MLPANSWHRAAVAQKRLWTAGSAARRYLAPTCAGYLVGRDIRAVEWDAASSPSLPDGRAVSFKLRALTPEGLRIALAKQYRLEGAKDVKQVRSSTEVAASQVSSSLSRVSPALPIQKDCGFLLWCCLPG